MTVEVAEGKSEGTMEIPGGAGGRDANGGGGGGGRCDWNPDGRGGATGAVCVVPVMARCVTPAVLKGTGAFDPVVNVGNRGRGRGIREGGVQRLRQTAPELDDDRSPCLQASLSSQVPGSGRRTRPRILRTSGSIPSSPI